MNNDEIEKVVKETVRAIDLIQDEVYECMSEYKWNYWYSGFVCGCLTGVLIAVVLSIVYIHTKTGV